MGKLVATMLMLSLSGGLANAAGAEFVYDEVTAEYEQCVFEQSVMGIGMIVMLTEGLSSPQAEKIGQAAMESCLELQQLNEKAEKASLTEEKAKKAAVRAFNRAINFFYDSRDA